MTKDELDKYKELEFVVEKLVDYCNNVEGMATACEVIAVEAALERLYKARQRESERDDIAALVATHVRKECAELCRAEANGRSPLAFDALHECADLIMQGYEK